MKIGDGFEINTLNGIAFLQYVYEDDHIGEMVRVLHGRYEDNKSIDLQYLLSLPEDYLVSFPLKESLKNKTIKFVASHKLENFTKPKFMRTKHNIRGNFLGWHIVDTETWNRELVEELTEEQKRMSPWGIWSEDVLIERLNNDWSLDNWI